MTQRSPHKNSPHKSLTSVEKRSIIVEAALELFAKHGYDGVSLREISKQSGFNNGSLYHFFPEKHLVYDAVVTLALERVAARLIAPIDLSLHPEDQLRLFIEEAFLFFAGDDPAVLVMDREYLARDRGQVVHLIEGLFQQTHKTLLPMLQAVTRRRVLKSQKLDWLISHIFSSVYGAAKLHFMHESGFSISSKKKQRQFLDDFTNYVLAAVR